MKTSKYSEAQKIAALKQLDAGRKSEEIGRELGVSKHTVYAWKQKYGALTSAPSHPFSGVNGRRGVLQRGANGVSALRTFHDDVDIRIGFTDFTVGLRQ